MKIELIDPRGEELENCSSSVWETTFARGNFADGRARFNACPPLARCTRRVSGPNSNPLLAQGILYGAESFAFISFHGFLPGHNETVRAKRAAPLRPRVFTMLDPSSTTVLVGRCVKLPRNACQRCFRRRRTKREEGRTKAKKLERKKSKQKGGKNRIGKKKESKKRRNV